MKIKYFFKAKGYISLCFFCIGLGIAVAQSELPLFQKKKSFSLGLRIGFNQYNAQLSQSVGKFYIHSPNERQYLYYHMGVITQKKWKRWHVQSEVNYNYNVMFIQVYNTNPDPFPNGYVLVGSDYKVRGLSIPIIGGYMLKSWLTFFAGPVVYWHWQDDLYYDDRPDYQIFDSIAKSYKTFSMGYRFGIGLTYNRFSLDLYFEGKPKVNNYIIYQKKVYPFRASAQIYHIGLRYQILLF